MPADISMGIIPLHSFFMFERVLNWDAEVETRSANTFVVSLTSCRFARNICFNLPKLMRKRWLCVEFSSFSVTTTNKNIHFQFCQNKRLFVYRWLIALYNVSILSQRVLENIIPHNYNKLSNSCPCLLLSGWNSMFTKTNPGKIQKWKDWDGGNERIRKVALVDSLVATRTSAFAARQDTSTNTSVRNDNNQETTQFHWTTDGRPYEKRGESRAL